MRKPTKRRSKYYAPQNEGEGNRCCDHPGCSEPGEFRAPKDRDLKEYYWFCLKHVQEYNAKWNYYDGLDPEQEQREEKLRRHRFSFNSKVKYNFGFDFNGNFEFFDNYDPDFSAMDTPFLTPTEMSYLKVMELKLDQLSVDSLKKQYKKLVKKYHPDINREDKDAEEKFKLLGQAYKALLAKLSR